MVVENRGTVDDDGLVTPLLVIFYRHKLMLSIALVVSAILFFGGSYLVKPRYRAQVRVIPSSVFSGDNTLGNAGGLLSLARGVGIGFRGNTSDPSLLIPGILKSDDFLEILLGREFEDSRSERKSLLQWVTDEAAIDDGNFAKVTKYLRSDVLSTNYDSKSGVTTISVVMVDPVLSARVANECVTNIDSFHLKMRSSQASNEEEFVSQRLEEVRDQLDEAENRLTKFRLNNRRINESPNLRAEEARLQMEFQLNQDLYLTLKQQKEISSIQKLRSVPSLSVLETARPVLKPVIPNRASFAIGGGLMGFAALALFLILRPSFRKISRMARFDDSE